MKKILLEILVWVSISSFMVSERVEVYTKSFRDEPATYWSCDGSPEYELYTIEKA